MLSLVVLATTLWVCPGNEFSNEPKPGCKPFEGTQGTVNIDPNTTEDGAAMPPSRSSSRPQNEGSRAEPQSAVNQELCAMYKEYIDMTVRTQGGFQTNGPEDLQRWQTLKRMFQVSAPPRCD